MFSLWKKLFLSPEELKLIDTVVKRNVPISVIGRGTVYIDPRDIIKSEQFKKYVEQASKVPLVTD